MTITETDGRSAEAIRRLALSTSRQEIARAGIWADPEDLAQEALARLQAQEEAPLDARRWLRTVIRHLAIDQQRREARGVRPMPTECIEDAGRNDRRAAARLGEIVTMESRIAQQASVDYVLEQLTDREQTLIRLRCLAGDPAQRVATALGLPSRNAVDQAYRRALQRLKRLLAERPDLREALRP